jgi:hypothetical protein
MSGHNAYDREQAEALKKAARVINSDLTALLCAFEELLYAAIEYHEYEHDGDPWTEDARAMGEMTIDDMANDGRLDKYKALLQQIKLDA